MNDDPFLSIVIPCYNEEDNLNRGVLFEVFEYLLTKDYSWEVIISDDGSTDKSKDIVEKQIRDFSRCKLLENTHGGKPSALLSGVKSCMGKFVLFTDMDQSTPITDLDKLLLQTTKYDVVIGSRGMARKNFPVYRKLGARVFMFTRKLLILPEITDTQCGFKLFEKSCLTNAFPKLQILKASRNVKGWKVTSYDVELLHILKKDGARIKEVDVEWEDRDARQGNESSLTRYLRESIDMLKEIITIKRNDLKGTYEE